MMAVNAQRASRPVSHISRAYSDRVEVRGGICAER